MGGAEGQVVGGHVGHAERGKEEFEGHGGQVER